MGWILQGNPKRFDIDGYLSSYLYIYWSAPTNQRDFGLADRVFIWRAGEQAGAVAIGRVQELPVARHSVRCPEALGDDLWVSTPSPLPKVVIGIAIEEVCLTPEEGMLTRTALQKHPLMGKHRIIRAPQGTVFHLSTEEGTVLEHLWGTVAGVDISSPLPSALEGTLQLRLHHRRERSRTLIEQKKAHFKRAHGRLRCEVCRLSFAEVYPSFLGVDFIEVHHIVPLNATSGVVRTTLDDLILVCANCHRMIHRSMNCENNLKLLREHFAQAFNIDCS
jgi:HNH endonuclease